MKKIYINKVKIINFPLKKHRIIKKRKNIIIDLNKNFNISFKNNNNISN